MSLVVILVFCGLSAGVIGRIKGGSFLLWFAIGFCLPVLGTVAAVLYRYEQDELLRRCPECSAVIPLHDQVCMRCGVNLDWPDEVLQRPARTP
ncbi:MAG: hypothetical protein H0V29_11685 [Thermoleophilaceae bacterium]|nr:hypothetical protein [Thermoleophilaceae bacterium]